MSAKIEHYRSASTGISEEQALRIDLAAAFRLAAQFDWHESVGNHFSVALDDKGETFLINPKWRHFNDITASNLVRVDTKAPDIAEQTASLDATAWTIHSAVHRLQPRAKVLLHCHPAYATALCGLQDPGLKPIDQNTARFFNRVAIDLGFNGLADDAEEGERLAAAFSNRNVMLMGNHGVSVVGSSVAEAFEILYFLERAARTMVLAYSTGQPLNIMSDNLAEKTASGWDAYNDMAFDHFAHLKRQLDRTSPDYAN